MQRRQFLNAFAASAGLMLPLGPHAWAATMAPGSSSPTAKKLIVVMLRGAVDGLNVVAPVADPEYARLRPNIALARPGTEDSALNLDGYFGLHPALAPLMPLWEQKKLAFVHASGSPDASRSHFDAQDYMESATPGVKSTQDGWMNRLLGSLPGETTPTRALSIGPVMPRVLSGAQPATNLANGAAGTRSTPLDRPQIAKAFDALYAGNERYGKVYQAGRKAHEEVMAAANGGMMSEMQAADNGAPLPNGFPDDAGRLATLMRNNPNIQLAFVALGGWDTHANQGAGTGQLANRLQPLGQGWRRWRSAWAHCLTIR